MNDDLGARFRAAEEVRRKARQSVDKLAECVGGPLDGETHYYDLPQGGYVSVLAPPSRHGHYALRWDIPSPTDPAHAPVYRWVPDR